MIFPTKYVGNNFLILFGSCCGVRALVFTVLLSEIRTVHYTFTPVFKLWLKKTCMVHSANLYQINDSPLERSNNRTVSFYIMSGLSLNRWKYLYGLILFQPTWRLSCELTDYTYALYVIVRLFNLAIKIIF